MVECLNGHHRSRLASRRAGDGAYGHRAGEAWTGPNRWRDRRERGQGSMDESHSRTARRTLYVAVYFFKNHW